MTRKIEDINTLVQMEILKKRRGRIKRRERGEKGERKRYTGDNEEDERRYRVRKNLLPGNQG